VIGLTWLGDRAGADLAVVAGVVGAENASCRCRSVIREPRRGEKSFEHDPGIDAAELARRAAGRERAPLAGTVARERLSWLRSQRTPSCSASWPRVIESCANAEMFVRL
jgi:hypothetical protein